MNDATRVVIDYFQSGHGKQSCEVWAAGASGRGIDVEGLKDMVAGHLGMTGYLTGELAKAAISQVDWDAAFDELTKDVPEEDDDEDEPAPGYARPDTTRGGWF